MKPNNAKVIVLPAQMIWRNRQVDVEVPACKRILPRALNWLQQFAEQHNRMLLHSEQVEVDSVFINRQRGTAYAPLRLSAGNGASHGLR